MAFFLFKRSILSFSTPHRNSVFSQIPISFYGGGEKRERERERWDEKRKTGARFGESARKKANQSEEFAFWHV